LISLFESFYSPDMRRTSLAIVILLGLCPAARARVVLPPRASCPAPQLPSGSLVFSAADTSAAVFMVAVDGQHVFWTDGRGQLWRAPKSGGAPTRIVAEHAHSLLLLGSDIYYTSERSIRKIASTGGTPSVVIQESEDPIVLVSDGRSLFYSMYDGSPVRQLELATGKVVRRFAGSKHATLAVAGGELYVASYRDGTITRHSLGKKPPKVVVRGERTVVGISVDAGAIYYSVEKGGWVKRLPRAGGRARVLARDQFNQEGLELDGDHVYWFDWRGGEGQHTLWRTRRAGGGAVEKVLGGLCGPHYLAIDERHLYIANKGAGTVLKIPKPASGGSSR
jgi:hypothetical protein